MDRPFLALNTRISCKTYTFTKNQQGDTAITFFSFFIQDLDNEM